LQRVAVLLGRQSSPKRSAGSGASASSGSTTRRLRVHPGGDKSAGGTCYNSLRGARAHRRNRAIK